MKRVLTRALLVVFALTALVAVGCGSSDKKSSSDTKSSDSSGQAAAGTKRNLTIAVITHGDGGSFWAVVKKGAEDGARDMGVTLKYNEANNDPEKQAQMIEAAVTEKVDGLAVSAPNPDALKSALQKARDAGIPIVTLNSGAEESANLGAFTHVGQTEGIAGEGAGAKFKAAGAKKLLCIIHEQSNIGLNQRCEGAKKGFGGQVEDLQVKGTDDISTTLTEIKSKLQSDKSIDAVLALNPDIAVAARDAVADSGSSAKLATFDLSGDVVKAIKDGEIEFAVDQQQYLQGYLSVVFLTLNKTNLNTVGGGLPVLTGPGFVDKTNAAQIEELASKGTR